MTQCVLASGPVAYTESTEVLTRVFSRGGIWPATEAAISDSAASCWSAGNGLICSSTIFTVATTPSITSRLRTPPTTRQLATRGSFLNHTGCEVPPHGTAIACSCWPGTLTSYVEVSGHWTYWFCSR